MKSILDRSFKYVPSGKTDLRKTFARIRRLEKEKQEAEKEVPQNVCALKERRK